MPSMAQGGLRNFTENPNQLNRKFPNHEAKVDPFSRKQKIAQHRKSLPIASVEKRLVDEVRKNDTLIIVGETGSGKTTQLPQFLFNAGFYQDGRTIGITQPRHVAAVTVAKRVAEECDVQLGQRVGYSIRFDDTTSGSTGSNT
ncbi:pre-mRNA-splicing factor ATP-dependent RNA helicase DEAH10-like [Quercus robur]|uniref:pre-mRNA-splicing factor ATP-dependent RNA helicase DEAH10-like n=1 Tax=Quercus robur TaxID=38942 RepID=UPI002162B089|nr:pre-mRNA-splicing factor ATP-dependent RNA helicase DEAH10-like [Quercus robur]